MPPDTVRDLRLDIARVESAVLALTARLDERCKGHGEKIDDCAHTLFGNGSPGVKTRVERLEGKMSIIWAAIGAGGAALIGLVVDAAWRAMNR
jgi:hypothetical protein